MLEVQPLQQTPGMCGPYSLKMVMDYYGKNISINKVIKAAHATIRFGATAENIVEAARHFGFHAHITEFASFRDIRKYVHQKKVPVILNWFREDDGHYSTVVDINNKDIYLQDPFINKIEKFSLATFRRLWFGFAGNYPSHQKDIFIRRMIVVRPRASSQTSSNKVTIGNKNRQTFSNKLKAIRKKLKRKSVKTK